MTPFRQGRYEDLPETPRTPHPYPLAPSRTVSVRTPELGEVETHVVVTGSGPPLLLVHGLMTSSYSWRYVLEPLAAHFTVYAPDLPGSGRSSAPRGVLSPEALARWVSALVDALGIRGCAAIGNSMGGYLTLHVVLQDPTAFGRLLVAHAPGVPELRILALSLILAVPGARGLLDALVRRDPLRWAHRHVHYWDESLKSMEEAREYGGPLATVGGRDAFASALGDTLGWRAMRRFQQSLRARAPLPVPIRLVYARRDPMVPPRFGPIYAERLGVGLDWIEQGSHFAHVDAVEAFLGVAVPFLTDARVAGPSSSGQR